MARMRCGLARAGWVPFAHERSLPRAPGPLVDVAWLAAHGRSPRPRRRLPLVPRRSPRRRRSYARGHIPGAVHLDVDADLSSPAHGGPGRHPLPDAAAFARVLAHIGVIPGSVVVGYDDAGGAIAARLWWLLRYFGHPGGRVLDGGLQAWTSADTPSRPRGTHDRGSARHGSRPRGRPGRRQGGCRQAAPRFRGGDPRCPRPRALRGQTEPVDARPGHIPGARSAPFAENLSAPGGAFRGRAELERRYRDLGALDAATVVCYCGSGVTACHDLLALTTLGREDAILYEGPGAIGPATPPCPRPRAPSPERRPGERAADRGLDRLAQVARRQRDRARSRSPASAGAPARPP